VRTLSAGPLYLSYQIAHPTQFKRFSVSRRYLLTSTKQLLNYKTMNKKSVLDKYEQLPPNAKKEAEDFVEFLYHQYAKPSSPKKIERPLSDYNFVGMWKDKEDMEDSTAWVKKQRKTQWRNR
jgi:predicted SnoaL-like aldol condensation-catalyzing enzyme